MDLLANLLTSYEHAVHPINNVVSAGIRTSRVEHDGAPKLRFLLAPFWLLIEVISYQYGRADKD